MNISKYKITGYFFKNYFNWSMDYSELESCIEDFLVDENKEKIEAFRKEVETLYMLNDPELIREVAHRFGDRGMPTDKAIKLVNLLRNKIK